MKKGKTSKITGFKTCKVSYGTVNSKEFKSLYLNLQTWVEPKKESLNWERVVLNMTRDIKHSVFNNIDKNIFDEKFIVDLDLRTSGIQLKKKSFMNLEINLFVLDSTIDFKSNILKKSLKKLSKDIYSEIFTHNKHFKFYLTKKGNIRVEKIKTESI